MIKLQEDDVRSDHILNVMVCDPRSKVSGTGGDFRISHITQYSTLIASTYSDQSDMVHCSLSGILLLMLVTVGQRLRSQKEVLVHSLPNCSG